MLHSSRIFRGIMLSAQQIRKIAKLAHLKLTEAEVEKFSKELTDILDFFEQLQEVDTDGVKPTAQITGLKNVTRQDEVIDCEESEALLKSSPNPIVRKQISVKPVL